MTKLKKFEKEKFALETIYDKLSHGTEDLENEECVDELLRRVDILRNGFSRILEKFYEGAEDKQQGVLREKAEQFEALTDAVKGAAISGNLDDYNSALQDVVNASIDCKESATKMKHIQNKGFEKYDPVKEMRNCIRNLEEYVKGAYKGRKLIEAKEDE